VQGEGTRRWWAAAWPAALARRRTGAGRCRNVAWPRTRLLAVPPSRTPGLLTWSEIWCDVENSKSFRSSCDRRVSPGRRLKGASALHNYLALIFTAPGVATWNDMPGSSRKNQVTRPVTLCNRSHPHEQSGGPCAPGNSAAVKAPRSRVPSWQEVLYREDVMLGVD